MQTAKAELPAALQSSPSPPSAHLVRTPQQTRNYTPRKKNLGAVDFEHEIAHRILSRDSWTRESRPVEYRVTGTPRLGILLIISVLWISRHRSGVLLGRWAFHGNCGQARAAARKTSCATGPEISCVIYQWIRLPHKNEYSSSIICLFPQPTPAQSVYFYLGP
jgi:hypothetical protein